MKVDVSRSPGENSLFFQTQKEPEACKEEIHQGKVGSAEDSLSNSDMQTSEETRRDVGSRER